MAPHLAHLDWRWRSLLSFLMTDQSFAAAARRYAGGRGGTEYFLSSWAVYTGVNDQISVWAVTGTSGIDSNPAGLNLIRATVGGMPYAVPGRSVQKAGDYPVGQCLVADAALCLERAQDLQIVAIEFQ